MWLIAPIALGGLSGWPLGEAVMGTLLGAFTSNLIKIHLDRKRGQQRHGPFAVWIIIAGLAAVVSYLIFQR